MQRRLSHALPAIRVRQQLPHPGFELARVCHEHGALRLEKELGAFAEIAGVRAEEDGLSQEGRLQHVVPARGHEAAPDEDHGGYAIDLGELAHRVEDDHGVPLAVAGQPAPPDRAEARVGGEALHLCRAVGMPGRQKEGESGKADAQALESLEHGRFLAAVRAARDPHEIAFGDPEQALPHRLTARLGWR